jgi:uncharacterized RDD family membrane protein YckC
MTDSRSIPYAGVVSRTLALTLDVLLLSVVILVLGVMVGVAVSVVVPGDHHVHVGVSIVSAAFGALSLITGLYLICFWTLAGQTPGMRLMRLRVTSLDGDRPRPGRGLVRVIGMVLAALPLMAGYAMILVDDRRQGLHDKLARTQVLYVVADEAEPSFGPARVEPLGGRDSLAPAVGPTRTAY